jgi:hypothetical protein
MPEKPPMPAVIAEDKLRYRSKPVGSSFGSLGNPMRSCFRCGAHRAPTQLRAIKFLGRSERVCEPSCTPAGSSP